MENIILLFGATPTEDNLADSFVNNMESATQTESIATGPAEMEAERGLAMFGAAPKDEVMKKGKGTLTVEKINPLFGATPIG